MMHTFYMWHYTPHRCPSRGDWQCTSPLYESLTSTHLWLRPRTERTRDPSIASSAELGRTLWDNSQSRRCRLHCFISRVRKNSQASSIELGRSLVESDNTPHINSLGANPELIHQVVLTTRLLQAHPTVNSSLSPGTQTTLNQRHSTPSGICIKSSHAHLTIP